VRIDKARAPLPASDDFLHIVVLHPTRRTNLPTRLQIFKMPAQNDVEMQYQATAPMDAGKTSVDTASTQDQVR
jgi:hypothetical protein